MTYYYSMSHWVWATAWALKNAPIINRENFVYGSRVKRKEKYLYIPNVITSIILKREIPGNKDLFTFTGT